MRTRSISRLVRRTVLTLLFVLGVLLLLNRALASPLVVSTPPPSTPIHYTFTPQLVGRALSQPWQAGDAQMVHWSPAVNRATHAAQPIPIVLLVEVHGPFPSFADAADQAVRNSCLAASLSPTNRVAAAPQITTTSMTKRSFDLVVALPTNVSPGFYYWLACAIQQEPGAGPRLDGGYSSAFEITVRSATNKAGSALRSSPPIR